MTTKNELLKKAVKYHNKGSYGLWLKTLGEIRQLEEERSSD